MRLWGSLLSRLYKKTRKQTNKRENKQNRRTKAIFIFKPLAKRTRKSTKLVKPELAYGLAMGGQTASRVDSQVQSRTFHAYAGDL